ncbi:2OG-Fe(II) oxygenase family protein [Brevundimonas sp.]|uniref:2OG-Fe(II) oxygenase n=1 Tax=Brevundimonas sp. TaxID=1871086 RepID=UPI0025CE71D7|nr:2OG-Fe(II) oxygenase family protein [Brevundimonas sp.]
MRLDKGLDPDAVAPVFKRFGRLHLPGLLRAEDALELHAGVRKADGWRRAIHLGPGQDYDMPMAELEAMAADERTALEAQVYASATDAFRYMFDTVRISQDTLKGQDISPALVQVRDFLNGEAFLQFVRRLTGEPRIVYADCMATRYLPGHFLTAHDDEAPGRDRLFAYVLNLTARWRADWGGMLLFLDEDDHVAEGYMPAFNSLNIFRVPQRHAVSIVAPFAGEPRLAITGWLRARRPEGWEPYA